MNRFIAQQILHKRLFHSLSRTFSILSSLPPILFHFPILPPFPPNISLFMALELLLAIQTGQPMQIYDVLKKERLCFSVQSITPSLPPFLIGSPHLTDPPVNIPFFIPRSILFLGQFTLPAPCSIQPLTSNPPHPSL